MESVNLIYTFLSAYFKHLSNKVVSTKVHTLEHFICKPILEFRQIRHFVLTIKSNFCFTTEPFFLSLYKYLISLQNLSPVKERKKKKPPWLSDLWPILLSQWPPAKRVWNLDFPKPHLVFFKFFLYIYLK